MTNCNLCGIDTMFHIKDAWGYILVLTPQNHPRRQFGDLIHEHILVAENKIGRYLKGGEYDHNGKYIGGGESVHHVNHVRDDNRPYNLSVMANDEDHAYIHKHSKKSSGMD